MCLSVMNRWHKTLQEAGYPWMQNLWYDSHKTKHPGKDGEQL